jgi:hypothetical protein
MLCESRSNYIYNIEIYIAQGEKLEDTVLSVVSDKLKQNNLYQDSYYSCVKVTEVLLDKKT